MPAQPKTRARSNTAVRRKKKTTYTLHTLATGLVLDQSPNEI
jgi:hypothetical protein